VEYFSQKPEARSQKPMKITDYELRITDEEMRIDPRRTGSITKEMKTRRELRRMKK
jgi:hypothetical protein